MVSVKGQPRLCPEAADSVGKQLLRLKLPTVAYYCLIKLTVKSHLLFSLKITQPMSTKHFIILLSSLASFAFVFLNAKS